MSDKKWLIVDWDEYLMSYLPSPLRTIPIYRFLRVPFQHLKTIHDRTRNSWAAFYDRLQHNGQVFSLIKSLNGAFKGGDFEYSEDKGEDFMYISDKDDTRRLWLSDISEYTDSTGRPKDTTVYISDKSNYVPKVDFTIIGTYAFDRAEELKKFIRERIPAGRVFALKSKRG